jgi:hypothetical protein
VSVSNSRAGQVFVGKSNAKDYTVFAMADLCQFVEFELSNLFFTVGVDIMLQQKEGAAMGGFTSPAAAQAVACVCEFTCLQRFVASGRLAAGRYMDDTLLFLNLSRLRGAGFLELLHALFTCYQPAGLELELERCGFKVTVLQSVVSTCGNAVQAVFWNKNADFAETGQQRVCRFIPAPHGANPAQQRRTVTSLMHRVCAATLPTSVHLLVPVIWQLRYELATLGYPHVLFDGCLRSFVHGLKFTPSFATWHTLWQRFRGSC